MPRPRTSTDPHADRHRTLGDAELAASPIFLAPRAGWSTETREEYDAYRTSEAAKALRAEDVYTVRRLFDYIDGLTLLWSTAGAAGYDRASLLAIATLQRMVSELSTQLGIGPRARQGLGIKTEAQPGDALDAFLAERSP